MISAGAPSGGFAGPAGRGSVTGSRLTKVCVAFPSPAPVGTAGSGLDAPPNVVHLSAVDLHGHGDTSFLVGARKSALRTWAGTLAPGRGHVEPGRVASGSGTISSRDLPPAVPDLRPAVQLAGPAGGLGGWQEHRDPGVAPP